MEDNKDFCRRRIAEELSAAERAPHSEAEKAHRKLAEIYATRLKLLEDTDLSDCDPK